jgi:Gas vesicle synthesis protein GvpL/GvpF
MASYLYCVLAPPKIEVFPYGLVGVGGTSVRALFSTDNRLEAWVGTVEESALRVSGSALAAQALVHNDVVQAALATGRTPVPARYGSTFLDDEACLANVAHRERELTGILDRIGGAVEMSVIITHEDERDGGRRPTKKPHRDEPAAGRRYLESIRQRLQNVARYRDAAEVSANEVATAVRGIVRGETQAMSSSGVLSIAHLVARKELDSYRRALSQLPRHTGVRLIIAGPRAPYSFVAWGPAVPGHDSGSPNRDE